MDAHRRKALNAELKDALQAYKDVMRDYKQQAVVVDQAERKLNVMGWTVDEAEDRITALNAKLAG